MQRYVKGARSERELLSRFYEHGFSVVRAAGSGVNALGPDIVAIKNGNCIAIECKAWDRGSLSLEPEQFEKLLEWERNTSFPTYVAWRVNNKGWFFIKLGEFTKGERNWNVTFKKVEATKRLFEQVIGDGHRPQDDGREGSATQGLQLSGT